MEVHPPSLLPFFVFNATSDLAIPYCWKMVSAAAIICPFLKMTGSCLSAHRGRNCLKQFSGHCSYSFSHRGLHFAVLSDLGFHPPTPPLPLLRFLECCAINFIILFFARGRGDTKQHSSVDESRSVWKVLHEVLLLAMLLCHAMSLLASPEKT